MNTRYINRIGVLQFKPTSTFWHRGKSSLAPKSKIKPATASKLKIEPTATFKEELDKVRIRTRRSPSIKDPEPSSHVNEILASKAFKHRYFRYAIDSAANVERTVVRLYKVKDEDGNLEEGNRCIFFDFGPISIRQNSDILRQAASTLAQILERWPHTLQFSTRHKKVLVDVALEHSSPRISRNYPRIEFDPPKSIYCSTVNGIDPNSGELYSVFVGVRPRNITDFEVRKTPKTEQFAFRETSRFQPQTVKNGNRKDAPMSPMIDEDTSDEGRKHNAAIKVLQLVLWKYHSKMLRLSDVQYAIEEVVLKYAARTKGSSGPYEGKPLYQLFSYRVGEYDFRPSNAVSRDTFYMLPSITVASSQAKSTLHVGDTITSTWVSTGDLKRAWLAGWEVAQTVNEEAKAVKGDANDKDWADWKLINKPLNIRTLPR